MKEVKIPDCKRIKFECITDNNTDVAEFLTYSLPDKLNFFVFNYGNGEVLLDSSYYIKGLINAAKATTTEMFITEVDFSSADFQSLFKACAHIENLIFCYCNLDLTSQLDLKGPEYVIQYLSFEMCGESHSNNWKNNKKRFKKLLKAIAESNVKNTLQTLNICDCGLEIEQVEDMLKSLQMYPQVEVIRESCPPIEE